MASSAHRDDRQGWLAARLLSSPLTARRAAAIVSVFTLSLTLAAALLAFLIDRSDFPSLGVSAWWAVQTLTTVGYGDFVPHSTEGRLIGSAVMLGGISFVAVVTASIAAALVEAARRRAGGEPDARTLTAQLEEISERLRRLEQAVNGGVSPGRPPDEPA